MVLIGQRYRKQIKFIKTQCLAYAERDYYNFISIHLLVAVFFTYTFGVDQRKKRRKNSFCSGQQEIAWKNIAVIAIRIWSMLRFGFIWIRVLLRSWNYCWHNEIIISDTQYRIFNICNGANWMWRHIHWTRSHVVYSVSYFWLLDLFQQKLANELSWESQVQY